MKLQLLLFIVAGGFLAGCANEGTPVTYREPLISPGGEFSKLPPTVQNSVRAEAGSAEIRRIFEETSGDSTIYIFYFKNAGVYPPLYVTPDGSVLTPNLNVAVGASQDSIEASTGHGSNGIKLDDLPPNVVNAIRSQAPTAGVDSVQRITSGSAVYYEVFFKDPQHQPRLLISEDGRVVR